MRKYISLLLALLLAFPVLAQDATIKILCLNDLHSAIDNMPKLAFVVDSIRKEHPDALLMAAGDIRTGNPFNDKCAVPNKPMIDLMNLVGFDMATMGNHECDGGVAAFVRSINDSFFPYLVANAYPADSLKMHIQPFRLFQRNGVKIGVLGLVQISDRGIPDGHPNLVKGVKFTNPFDEADNYRWLRDHCDVYIGLTHMGIEEDTIMADKHPEFDLLVCGHSHDLIPGTLRNGVMMVQGERWVKYLNEVDITVRDGKVVDRKCKTIDVTAATGVDPKAQAMVDGYNQAAEFYRVLAVATTPFEKPEDLGCLMADGIRAVINADFAFVNAGGVRYSEKEAGDFTVNDVLKLDPFDNELMLAKLSGHQVAEALAEIALADHYGPAYVSGLRYAIAPAGDGSGKNVVTLYDEQWKPLDMDKTYTVAVNSYIAAITPTIGSANPENTFAITANALMKYLEDRKTVDYKGSSRVKNNFSNEGDRLVEKFSTCYQSMIDEEIPVWKKDIAALERLYVENDRDNSPKTKFTKWGHVYIDYGNEWIWATTGSDTPYGAIFLRKDNKLKLIAETGPNRKPSAGMKGDTAYLRISGSAGGPAWYDEIYAFRDGEQVEIFTCLEIQGVNNGSTLNGKEIPAEQSKAYLDHLPHFVALDPYFNTVE